MILTTTAFCIALLGCEQQSAIGLDNRAIGELPTDVTRVRPPVDDTLTPPPPPDTTIAQPPDTTIVQPPDTTVTQRPDTTTTQPPDTTITQPPDTTATQRPDTTFVSAPTAGIWIGADEIAALPMSGPAWSALTEEAKRDCGKPNLSDQDQRNNVCVMAKALVFARTSTASYRDAVVEALTAIVESGSYQGRALALGRELGAYVIAADLIDLARHQPALDARFRAKLRELLRAPTSGGPGSLVECHEKRPNNWGAHCGGARAAAAVYLGDEAELARVALVFRGWLGDRSAYRGFEFGDLSWQCDPAAPVAINPAGCSKSGHNIDGVLPDDQRRASGFSWPPPKENYVYEALQGALMQAVILHRRGYDVWSWQDRALLRSFRWLHDVAGYVADGDDTWEPHVINRYYGTSFPARVPSQPGKNVGWTDWTR